MVTSRDILRNIRKETPWKD